MSSRRSLQLIIATVMAVSWSSGRAVPALASRFLSSAEGSYQVIKSRKVEGAIVPREMAADFVKSLTGSERGDYWTPAKEDVRKLEEKIEFYLRKHPDRRSPALWSKLSEYKRQYAGMVENGRRKILVNFFCNSARIKDWKLHPVVVEDGGDCFFQIKYDVEAGTFSDLYVNGEA
jgi:hypothetical protein